MAPFSTHVLYQLIPSTHFTDADAEELRGGLMDKAPQMWVRPHQPTRATGVLWNGLRETGTRAFPAGATAGAFAPLAYGGRHGMGQTHTDIQVHPSSKDWHPGIHAWITDPPLPWCIDSSSPKNKILRDPSQEEGHRVLHTSCLKPGGRRQG